MRQPNLHCKAIGERIRQDHCLFLSRFSFIDSSLLAHQSIVIEVFPRAIVMENCFGDSIGPKSRLSIVLSLSLSLSPWPHLVVVVVLLVVVVVSIVLQVL